MRSYLTIIFSSLVFILGSYAAKYNYSEVIHASLLFYEAQRSGKLPADNRIKWRFDSMLDDGKDVGHDLTGGYYDAGDLVKFNLPLAYTMTVLSWGVIDYEDAYTKAGELENARKAIKWGTDYLIKCRTSKDELYGQVGNGEIDHAVWGRPEDWPKDKSRPSYKVTSAHGGSDLAGETAAALAAASIVFKKSDPTYSGQLLKYAEDIYQFADKYRASYVTEITDVKSFYNSGGYADELGWSAAWLLRATNQSHYKQEVDKHFKEFAKNLTERPYLFGWDDKTAGVQVLLAEITAEDKYKTMTKSFCDWIVYNTTRTPKGMIFLDKWGTLRHAADVSFICLQAAKIGVGNAADYRKFAVSQIGYALGDTGRSFVVGYGVNPPTHEHHRPSSCATPAKPPAICHPPGDNGPNPQTLTGALVGGPDENDTYVDDRNDYVHNEVAEDYNACFQSSLAALLHLGM